MSIPQNQPPRYPTEPGPAPGSGESPPPAGPISSAEPTSPASTGPVSGEAAVAGAAPGFDSRGHVKNTRTSGVWIGLIVTAIFLILLIVFIAQNSRSVSIHFFGWHGRFSLALTILLSAVIGILLVAVPGTVRILQLRRALRKNGPGRL